MECNKQEYSQSQFLLLLLGHDELRHYEEPPHYWDSHHWMAAVWDKVIFKEMAKRITINSARGSVAVQNTTHRILQQMLKPFHNATVVFVTEQVCLLRYSKIDACCRFCRLQFHQGVLTILDALCTLPCPPDIVLAVYFSSAYLSETISFLWNPNYAL